MSDHRNPPEPKERDMILETDTPLAPGDADTPHSAAPERQVLVIDDDVTHRMVICRLAQHLGYAPTEAGTIAEAAQLMSVQHFDCMTLDLHMGAQSGTELLEVMNSKQSNVPLIVISGADDEERWEVLRVATLYGIRVTEVAKPLRASKLREVFVDIEAIA